MNQHVVNVIMMLAACGAFLVGFMFLSDNMEKLFGNSLKRLFNKTSKKKWVGVGMGAASTAVVQSSGVTTVMVVGFVNAGIMSLYQAATVIMGANIGTTITGIIVSLKSLPISDVAMMLAFVGVMMTFFKPEKIKQIGGILCGFGLIFVGLDLMGSALSPKNCPEITAFFQGVFEKLDFPLLLILCGMIFTALIQSSSAATGIFITMVATGALGLDNAIFLVLGSNIGTCITALLACLGTSVNAKRTALIHLTFNVAGTILFTAFLWPLQSQVMGLLEKIPGGSAMQLAWFHVIFNVTTTVVLLPFIKQLVQFATFVIKEKNVDTEGRTLRYVDERLLKTPAIAMMQVKKEIEYMSALAKENIANAFAAMEGGASEFAPAISDNEERIDFTNKAVTKYLIKLSPLVDGKEERSIGSYFHVVNDLERIGDHAENFCEIGVQMQAEGLTFSEAAQAEIKEMSGKVLRMFEIAAKAFEDKTAAHLQELTALENQVDGLKRELSARHYARLAEGKCKIEHSPYYTSIVVGLERVADHLVNVGYSVLNPTGSQSEARLAKND